MTAAFLSTLALLVVVAIVLVVREVSHRTALGQAREEIATLTERAGEADRLRLDAESAAEQQHEAAAQAAAGRLAAERVTADREAAGRKQAATAEAQFAALDASSKDRIRQLERRLRDAETGMQLERVEREAAHGRVADLEVELGELRHHRADAEQVIDLVEMATASGPVAVPAPAPASAPSDAPPLTSVDAGWRLLLARIERQWADAVNAGPGERGVRDGSRGQQLAEAVHRDLERLREEVGVETVAAQAEPVEYGDPVTTLLAVGEAVALLAYHSEQVQVDLRDPAVVTGQDWTGDDEARGRLREFAALASAAGVPATAEVVEGAARLVIAAPPPVL